MKRAAFLHCVDLDLPRFKLLKQRKLLPSLPVESEEERGADYSIEDAFRLRLMLDLVGGEDAEDGSLAGLGPTAARDIVNNVLGKYRDFFPRHPLNQIEPSDWWLGVVVFEQGQREGGRLRTSEWIGAELDRLHLWIADRSKSEMRADGAFRKHPVRVFMVNVSRAARFVQFRAVDDPGMPEIEVYAEVRS